VVDSGVHGYGGSPFRAYCRSTRAHNTVSIAGREQLECWGDFRVGRRYRPTLHRWRATNLGQYLCASHDGFRPCTHTRHFLAPADEGLLIVDEISGPGPIRAESFVHLHPGVNADRKELGWSLGDTGLVLQVWNSAREQLITGQDNPKQGWYCPRFGEALPAPVIILAQESQRPFYFGYAIRTDWLKPDELDARMEALLALGRDAHAAPGDHP